MRNAWYPATTVDPATCATYTALDLFRLLNVVGNINVHDFVGVLERNTDPLRVNKVPVRLFDIGHQCVAATDEYCRIVTKPLAGWRANTPSLIV
jgi:hypothetical protein